MSVSGRMRTDQLLADLRGLCIVPSLATRPQELAAAAASTAALMRAAGLDVQLVATDGPPLVIGYRQGQRARTLLLYHHYDVAPSGPWRTWSHEPFMLAERGGLLYGRGVAVGKGPLAAHLASLAALAEGDGGLPCGVAVVAEGRGLSGSQGLELALGHVPESLHGCLASLGEHSSAALPFCYSGVKGLLQVQLSTRSAGQPLPSGLAASVRNPLWRLLWALSSIKTEDEALQIEGFEDEIEPFSRESSQALRAASLDEQGRLQAWDLESFLFDMHGPGLLRTEASLPTCNISQLSSEPVGDFQGIPTSASARLDFHLVPNQQPRTLAALLEAHLDRLGYADIVAQALPGGYAAARVPISTDFVQQVSSAGNAVFGNALPLLPMGYFALPLALLAATNTMPIASVGCAPVDGGSVGADEHVALDALLRHGELLAALLRTLAA